MLGSTNARTISSFRSVDMMSSLTLMRPFFKWSCRKDLGLSHKPVEFEVVKIVKVIVDVGEWEKTLHNKPGSLRWFIVKTPGMKALSRVIDVEKSYNFRPYSYNLTTLPHYCFILTRASKSRWSQGEHSPYSFVLLVSPRFLCNLNYVWW